MENVPVLKSHDAKGNRLDHVEYHPAYHALMRRAVTQGLHCSIWDEDPAEMGMRNRVRAAKNGLLHPVLNPGICVQLP